MRLKFIGSLFFLLFLFHGNIVDGAVIQPKVKNIDRGLKWDSPPLHIEVRGWYCLSDKLTDANNIKNLIENIKLLAGSGKAGTARALPKETGFNLGRETYLSDLSQTFIQSANKKPEEMFGFKEGKDLQKIKVFDPAPDSEIHYALVGCLTKDDMKTLKNIAIKASQAYQGNVVADVGDFPEDERINILVRRSSKPLPVGGAGAGGAGAGGAGGAGAGGAGAGSAGAGGTDVGSSGDAKKDVAKVDKPIPRTQRRHTSFFRPSVSISGYGPGKCGLCRAKNVRECFEAKCANIGRESWAIENDIASGGKKGKATRLLWSESKLAALKAKETEQFNQCNAECRMAPTNSCMDICGKTKVGDKYMQDLPEKFCSEVTKLARNHNAFERYDEMIKKLTKQKKGLLGSKGRDITPKEYLTWRMQIKTDPVNLYLESTRKNSGVKAKVIKKETGVKYLRDNNRTWYEPRNQVKKDEECCEWNQVTGNDVKKFKIITEGTEYDYDFLIPFVDLNRFEKWATTYMNAIFATKPGLDGKSPSPDWYAEQISKMSGDAAQALHGNQEAAVNGAIRSAMIAGSGSKLGGSLNAGWNWLKLGKVYVDEVSEFVNKGGALKSGKVKYTGNAQYLMPVKGKRFVPERICYVPLDSYLEITDDKTVGKFFCDHIDNEIGPLLKKGIKNECKVSDSQTATAGEGCWKISYSSLEGDVLLNESGEQVTARVSHGLIEDENGANGNNPPINDEKVLDFKGSLNGNKLVLSHKYSKKKLREVVNENFPDYLIDKMIKLGAKAIIKGVISKKDVYGNGQHRQVMEGNYYVLNFAIENFNYGQSKCPEPSIAINNEGNDPVIYKVVYSDEKYCLYKTENRNSVYTINNSYYSNGSLGEIKWIKVDPIAQGVGNGLMVRNQPFDKEVPMIAKPMHVGDRIWLEAYGVFEDCRFRQDSLNVRFEPKETPQKAFTAILKETGKSSGIYQSEKEGIKLEFNERDIIKKGNYGNINLLMEGVPMIKNQSVHGFIRIKKK